MLSSMGVGTPAAAQATPIPDAPPDTLVAEIDRESLRGAAREMDAACAPLAALWRVHFRRPTDASLAEAMMADGACAAAEARWASLHGAWAVRGRLLALAEEQPGLAARITPEVTAPMLAPRHVSEVSRAAYQSSALELEDIDVRARRAWRHARATERAAVAGEVPAEVLVEAYREAVLKRVVQDLIARFRRRIGIALKGLRESRFRPPEGAHVWNVFAGYAGRVGLAPGMRALSTPAEFRNARIRTPSALVGVGWGWHFGRRDRGALRARAEGRFGRASLRLGDVFLLSTLDDEPDRMGLASELRLAFGVAIRAGMRWRLGFDMGAARLRLPRAQGATPLGAVAFDRSTWGLDLTIHHRVWIVEERLFTELGVGAGGALRRGRDEFFGRSFLAFGTAFYGPGR